MSLFIVPARYHPLLQAHQTPRHSILFGLVMTEFSFLMKQFFALSRTANNVFGISSGAAWMGSRSKILRDIAWRSHAARTEPSCRVRA